MMNNNLIPETVKYMIQTGKTINTGSTLGFCVPGNPPSITLQEVEAIFSKPISWCPDLPLKGAGYSTPYYLKD